ncbi:hypothetical protein [Nocardia niigatensis]|uniref:hypothetical protein n=1 Tax=Nocardia niigatensis TaxID=209249 RepID=UPI0003044115|nr:hypothetical protein [Nocardia niigatensis]
MTLPDLHVIPPEDTQEHSQSPDCPCGPRRVAARGRSMWAHQLEGVAAPEPTGIRFRKEPPCPMEEALVEWMRCAELRKDGEVTHTGVNLVGREDYARHYAKTIADHIKANGPDLAALTYHLQHPLKGGQKVRAYAHAGHIAEGAIEALTRKGLI